jgi:hypothetical protein
MKKTCLLICITYLFLVASCSDKSTNIPSTPQSIFPMSVGNSWTYNNYTFDKIKKDSMIFNKSETLNIDSFLIINNEKWYHGIFDDEYLFTNRSDGFWRLAQNDNHEYIIDSAELFIKYPTSIGDKVYLKDKKNPLETVELNVTVSVPAGTFNCVKYKYHSGDDSTYNMTENMYLSPRIGLVKDEITSISTYNNKTDTSKRVMLLMVYHLK